MFEDKTEYKIRNRTNRLYIGLFVFLIMILIFFTYVQVLAQFKTGEQIADFSLTGLNGETYQLNQFKNKFNSILLCFVENTDSGALSKIQDVISFFQDYTPKETYQIIVVIADRQNEQELREKYISLQEKIEIPLLILWDEEAQVTDSFEIRKFPTIVLLRYDLGVRRVFSGLSTQVEKSFYQYLTFTFTSQKTGSSGCEGGVCPPPPGY